MSFLPVESVSAVESEDVIGPLLNSFILQLKRQMPNQWPAQNPRQDFFIASYSFRFLMLVT